MRKISVWEIFDFQCIYLTKLKYRPSLKYLQTFKMIRDYMTVSVYLFQLVKYNPVFVTTMGIHYFSSSSQKTNLHERFHTVTKLQWTFSMMLQTVRFEALAFLSCWYMLFQLPAIIADSESAKHACKSYAVSVENYLYW